MRFAKLRFIKNNMRLLTYGIHVAILLIIISIHGRFVTALEIATSLTINAQSMRLNRFRLIEIETANPNAQRDHLLFSTMFMHVLWPYFMV